jgi:hypothetical protein
MTRGFVVFGLLFAVAACAPNLTLRPAQFAQHPEAVARCQAPFPSQPWWSSHTLAATLPQRRHTAFLGVAKLYPATRAVHAILMSPEQFTLLDATSAAGAVTIDHALPPFDAPAFTAGVMADLELLFFTPRGRLDEVRRYPDGQTDCLWRAETGEQTMLTVAADGGWLMRTYDRAGRRQKEVAASAPSGGGLASTMKLRTRGTAGYTLALTLLEAGAITTGEQP